MSDSQGGAGRREVAFRLFAAEYDDADFSYSESDEERAPNYVVTPTGARVNRLFVVGVLTEVETVSDDYLRARVVDPTGPFVVYAGQYQPEAMNFLERAEPPMFVAVTGKARTFQPEDSDRVYTSIRPESINEVDAETRDRWVVQAAEQTIDRVARAAEAKHSGLEGDRLTAALKAHGVDDGLANGIPLAIDHYGTTGDYLAAVRALAVDAARVVANERDEVAGLDVGPADGADDPVESLVEEPIDTDGIDPDVGGEEGDEPPDVSDAPAPDTDPSPSDEEIDEAVEASEIDAAEESGAADTGTAVGASGSEAESEQASTDEGESATTEPAPAGEATGTERPAEETADVESSASDATEATETAEDSPTEPSEDDGDDLEEFDGEFELDEDERAEIEEEYGTEFQSGSEVSEPGEADIDVPETDPPAEPGEADALDEAATDEPSEDGAEVDEVDEIDDEDAEVEPETDEGAEEIADETAEDVALDDAVMDAMADLDDGDGADRDAVIAEVTERTGADPGDVEEAIQEALMDGRCYEPDDETLKAI